MADERYLLRDAFGSRSASNHTSACLDCGAVVYDTKAHDDFHDLLEELRAWAALP